MSATVLRSIESRVIDSGLKDDVASAASGGVGGVALGGEGVVEA